MLLALVVLEINFHNSAHIQDMGLDGRGEEHALESGEHVDEQIISNVLQSVNRAYIKQPYADSSTSVSLRCWNIGC